MSIIIKCMCVGGGKRDAEWSVNTVRPRGGGGGGQKGCRAECKYSQTSGVGVVVQRDAIHQ